MSVFSLLSNFYSLFLPSSFSATIRHYLNNKKIFRAFRWVISELQRNNIRSSKYTVDTYKFFFRFWKWRRKNLIENFLRKSRKKLVTWVNASIFGLVSWNFYFHFWVISAIPLRMLKSRVWQKVLWTLKLSELITFLFCLHARLQIRVELPHLWLNNMLNSKMRIMYCLKVTWQLFRLEKIKLLMNSREASIQSS